MPARRQKNAVPETGATQTPLELLHAAAEHLDSDIQARLDELRQGEQLLDVVTANVADILNATSLDGPLARALENLAAVVPVCRMVAIEVPERGRGKARMVHSWSAPNYTDNVDVGKVIQKRAGDPEILEWVGPLRRGKAVFAIHATATGSVKALLTEARIGSILLVPVMVSGRYWGQIAFDGAQGERGWTTNEVSALKMFADFLGVAVTREHFLNDVKRRDRLLQAVAKSATEIVASPNLDLAVAQSLELVGEALNASRAHIVEFTGGVPAQYRLRNQWQAGHPADGEALLQLMAQPHGPEVAAWMAPLHANQAILGLMQRADGGLKDYFARLDLLSTLVMPIMVDGKYWGHIGFDDCAKEREWSDNEIGILKTMADVIGTAIARDRYVEEIGSANIVIQNKNAALIETQAAVRNLLDNADQGFLTVGPDLLVGEQSSAACATILGEGPAGKQIVNLFGRDREDATGMQATLESVFRESPDFVRDLKVGLLPDRFVLHGKSIQTGYKYLADSGRLMLILTDVTETVQLTETVERERLRLEMIVLAVTEGEAFATLVDDYRKFLADELPPLIDRIETSIARGELYRHLHTYKGLLAQFSFQRSPKHLHALETKLADEPDWTASSARQTFAPEALLRELERDLESIGEVLGRDFISGGRRMMPSQRQLQALEKAAQDALASDEGRTVSPGLKKLLHNLASLGGLNVKAALLVHTRGARSLAARLDKKLASIAVEGEDVSLPAGRYDALFRAMVHVFRNAVDHGIEAPGDRLAAGKPADAVIHCDVRQDTGWVEICITDDGRGVDRPALEARLIGAGLDAARVRNFSLEELVFREGLSSRDAADEISGRGIGLSAVKSELDRLGGSVVVETKPGAGTSFRFRLPTGLDAPGS